MQLGNELLKSDMLANEGAFQKSKLAGRTMAGPVILKMKLFELFQRVFDEKWFPSCMLFRI